MQFACFLCFRFLRCHYGTLRVPPWLALPALRSTLVNASSLRASSLFSLRCPRCGQLRVSSVALLGQLRIRCLSAPVVFASGPPGCGPGLRPQISRARFRPHRSFLLPSVVVVAARALPAFGRHRPLALPLSLAGSSRVDRSLPARPVLSPPFRCSFLPCLTCLPMIIGCSF